MWNCALLVFQEQGFDIEMMIMVVAVIVMRWEDSDLVDLGLSLAMFGGNAWLGYRGFDRSIICSIVKMHWHSKSPNWLLTLLWTLYTCHCLSIFLLMEFNVVHLTPFTSIEIFNIQMIFYFHFKQEERLPQSWLFPVWFVFSKLNHCHFTHLVVLWGYWNLIY